MYWDKSGQIGHSGHLFAGGSGGGGCKAGPPGPDADAEATATCSRFRVSTFTGGFSVALSATDSGVGADVPGIATGGVDNSAWSVGLIAGPDTGAVDACGCVGAGAGVGG